MNGRFGAALPLTHASISPWGNAHPSGNAPNEQRFFARFFSKKAPLF